ncbi:MAG: SIMPL domain-containing protein [Bacteroidetes bacterium HGW-Bacteroidetes-14]|jgi:hypothetical protein|nr:MAG: SIMPL domain-containing protein [Bacteroidetes bacterium HGW-Bacteroidetes-14]
MKKLLIISLVLLISAITQAQEKSFLDINYVEVTTKADREVVPDKIYLSVTISEKENKGKISVEKQEKEMIKKLKDAGIDVEKNLSVSDMTGFYQKYILRKDQIMAEKKYQLIVPSAEMMAKVFASLESAGISDIKVIKSEVSDIDSVKEDVMRKASLKARKQADVIAGALGREIDKMVYFQSYDNFGSAATRYARQEVLAYSKAADSADEVVPDFEKIRVEHTIYVRFSLK